MTQDEMSHAGASDISSWIWVRRAAVHFRRASLAGFRKQTAPKNQSTLTSIYGGGLMTLIILHVST